MASRDSDDPTVNSAFTNNDVGDVGDVGDVRANNHNQWTPSQVQQQTSGQDASQMAIVGGLMPSADNSNLVITNVTPRTMSAETSQLDEDYGKSANVCDGISNGIDGNYFNNHVGPWQAQTPGSVNLDDVLGYNQPHAQGYIHQPHQPYYPPHPQLQHGHVPCVEATATGTFMMAGAQARDEVAVRTPTNSSSVAPDNLPNSHRDHHYNFHSHHSSQLHRASHGYPPAPPANSHSEHSGSAPTASTPAAVCTSTAAPSDNHYAYLDHCAIISANGPPSPSTLQPDTRLNSAFSTVGSLTNPTHLSAPPTKAPAKLPLKLKSGGCYYYYPPVPNNLNNTATISLPQPHHPGVAAGVVVDGNSSALSTPRPGSTATPATPATMPLVDPNAMKSPPEGIYRSFDDLLAAVQRVGKDQGYGVVKLRASNYRDGKPTRYDLVCDRGGVKYNSTAKKRNPSTRKVDCPWRAKAVCEVNLGNQWRFQVQEHRHNHEPRVPAAPLGQENTPIAQSIRSLTNKMDRFSHEMVQGFGRIEQRLEGIEKRLEAMEARMNTVEARMSGMESRGNGMDVPMDNMEMEGTMLGTAVM
ncbi:hypothetical protein AAE478_002714 [Parahypoxylon ruwenzoriense]